MDDLKSALINQIYDYLATEVFPIERRGDVIVDLTLNYIGFANKENACIARFTWKSMAVAIPCKNFL